MSTFLFRCRDLPSNLVLPLYHVYLILAESYSVDFCDAAATFTVAKFLDLSNFIISDSDCAE